MRREEWKTPIKWRKNTLSFSKMLLGYDTGMPFFTDILVKISRCRIVSSREANCQKWNEVKLIYHKLVFLSLLPCSCWFTVTERYEREKQDLEKHILELKAKLSHNAVMSEVEELKRCIERKDKEKAQLVMHVQVSWVLLLFSLVTFFCFLNNFSSV